jgi:3-oxoacyl-[acyl-carrier protein] reductase
MSASLARDEQWEGRTVRTGSDDLPDDLRKNWVAGIPMARTATAQDVANSILYLASDQAGFLTGVCLDIDGGRSIQ